MVSGPFSSLAAAAVAVMGLISSPFVYDRLQGQQGSAQERISAVIASFKEVKGMKEAEAVVSVAEDTRTAPQAPAPQEAPKEVVTTTQAPATTPAPTTPAPTTPAPEPKQPETTPKPKEAPEAEPKKSTETPPDQADSKSSVHPMIAKAVHFLEVNAVAFDRWCSGPTIGYLRERLAVFLKTSNILPYLEKGHAAITSFASEYGMSSVAASAIMSLALVADVLLIGFFVVWRLCKCLRSSPQLRKKDPREEKIAKMKEAAEKSSTPKASPKRANRADAKASPTAATPPSSGGGRRNRNRG